MKIKFNLTFALAFFLLTGCQTPKNDFPTNEPALTHPTNNSAIQYPPMPPITPDPTTQRIVEKARADLAQKLGIPADSIFVFSVEAVEWSDNSLGCPQPGISYAQVITPGYTISLEVNGQVYTFHTDEKEQLVLCTERGPDEIFLPP